MLEAVEDIIYCFPFQFLVGQQPIGKFDELEFQPGDAVVGLFYFTVEQVGGNLLQMVGGACGGRQYHNLGCCIFNECCYMFHSLYGADGSSAEFTNFHFLFLF